MTEKSPALRARNAASVAAAAARDVAAAELALPSVTNPSHRPVLELRIAHPDLSMSELGAMCTPPLGKDVYSGLLRRALNKRPTRAGERDE
jgi:DNA-binding transcriptional regulator WhiA